jgi:polyribonucleotide nucleotidyltransferase
MQLFEGSKTYTIEVGGRTLALETGILAAQAGGAVTVRYGDTVLLATAHRDEFLPVDLRIRRAALRCRPYSRQLLPP